MRCEQCVNLLRQKLDCPVITDQRGNRGGKPKKRILDLVTAFDIETTLFHTERGEQAVMYIWQWDFEGLTVCGRTWKDFFLLLDYLRKWIPDGVKLVVYVHNLSYEFHFLKGLYGFQQDEVFALKPHKVLRCDMMGMFEFRCSYLKSGMSLDKYLKQMDVPDKKLKLDYSVRRYPWTPLTKKELAYCINDVRGLVQAVRRDMELSGDDLLTIPLTSTGYLRRDVKLSMKDYPYYYLRDTVPDYTVYTLLREAFEGGDTHANRHFSGRHLLNVRSHDRSSSYPAEQVNEKFPMGKWRQCGNPDIKTFQKLSRAGNAWVARLRLTGVEMRDRYFPDPVLSESKCRNLSGKITDNGRVLAAEYLETTVTDVKYGILCEVYKWDHMEIESLFYSKYHKLPVQYRDVILENYRYKTELKGVEGEEYYYFKRKEKTNSAYGLSAQDPGKLQFIFKDNDFRPDGHDREQVYNKNTRTAFLSYAWGVWTTAFARLELYKGIRCVYDRDGYVVYWDTDSVKYIDRGIDYFKDYNDRQIKKCLETNGYADDRKGKRHYLGVYEDEGLYSDFKTLGAKKYVYRQDGKMHITIAGVNKIKGAKELEKHGGIDAFKTGFVFRDAGGTEAKYNTCHFDVEVDGRMLTVTDNVALLPSEYTVGITADYERLLKLLDQRGIDIVEFV